ncbi:unnamed protein product [Caenorhabditis brenneri]
MTCVIYPNSYTGMWKNAMKYVIPLIILIPFGTDWNIAISRVYMKPTFGGFYMEYIKKVPWFFYAFFPSLFSGNMTFGIALLSMDVLTVGSPIIMLCVSGSLREHVLNMKVKTTGQSSSGRVFTTVRSVR